MYLLLLSIIILTACDTVETTDRLIYEDGSSATGIPMEISNSEYIGKTITDKKGIFKFIAPADIEVKLCAYPSEFNSEFICYDGYIFTPVIDGNLVTIEY